MSTESSRREALRTAALGAGVIAAGGLLRPVAALAQTPSEEELRDFLVEAIALEQIAVLGYSTAAGAGGVSAKLKSTFERLRDQEQAHANAFRSALDSLGFDLPDAPDAPDDDGVFDDVEGLSDEAAERLTDTLAQLGEISKLDDYFAYLTGLEQSQIDYYLEAAPALDSEDLRTTVAEVVGNGAQHLVILRIEQDEDPIALIEGAAVQSGNSK